MTQLTATDRRCESVAEPATLASRPSVTVGGLVPLSAIPHATTRDRAACHFTIKSDRLRRFALRLACVGIGSRSQGDQATLAGPVGGRGNMPQSNQPVAYHSCGRQRAAGPTCSGPRPRRLHNEEQTRWIG